MTDYIDCTTNNIDIFTLIRSLFAQDASECHYLRVITTTEDATDCDPIDCLDWDTLQILFQRSIGLADDNKPALRIILDDFANGVGLEDVPDCGNQEDLVHLMRRAFVLDTNGEMAVNLANIT